MPDENGPAVVVHPTGDGRLVQQIEARSHVLISDEPAGTGDNRGPTPYELLLAALGACTSMTLRLYADEKGIALEDVSVRLSYERVHVQDAERCEEPGGRVHRIERKIRLTGDLSDAERARLLEIADRCPVHRTLTEEKEITSTLT